MRLRRLLIPVPLVALAAAGAAASAGTDGPQARSAAKHAYTSTLTYRETDSGTDSGDATAGIVGRGSFSAELGPAASVAAHVIGAATGVPLAKIAKGGDYAVRRDIDADGKITGIAVVKLKAHGLGTACLSYREKPGRFNGGGFVPMSGSFEVVGGKGAAKRWRVKTGFDQTDVSGDDVERFDASGSTRASKGAKKGFTKACRSVAKLPRG